VELLRLQLTQVQVRALVCARPVLAAASARSRVSLQRCACTAARHSRVVACCCAAANTCLSNATGGVQGPQGHN
jgi:hypothetical protein